MPKENTKKDNKDKKVIDTDNIEEEMKEEENDELSDDVQEALGMNKAERAAKMREIDYISELENSSVDSDDNSNEIIFDADFDSNYD
jgi:hypothetical protein